MLILILFLCALWVLDIRGSRSFISDKIKLSFSEFRVGLVTAYQRHFQQADTIAHYQAQIEAYQRLQFSYADLHARNQALALEAHDLSMLQSTQPPRIKAPDIAQLFAGHVPTTCTLDKQFNTYLYKPPRFTLTRVYGFAKLNNPYELLLDVQTPYPKDKILGMVAFGRTIGIALQQEGRFVGLLHGDARTSYSVAVKSGGKVYYGFISNQNFKTYVDFLPAYAPIKTGDIVVTSGLDGIFSAGIYVGKIAHIENHYAYKKASLQLGDLEHMLFYATLIAVP
ncbi:rod shape-determining protein MreC [Helicobacter baculiformis]|uniref:Rod shape-determining protein MreC n=1 Tax=Helicobacter baculiformis TaxID=427351 RepID=A0ABV7ZJ73_9HELI|nr:rod shape-determining protein MreC [Helicobacter baculiformis]